MQYLFYNVGNGELFEAIVRHGSHDIFWYYGFERDVVLYKKITSNQKANELSYTSFYLRRCFIITHININKDLNGLLFFTRDLLIVQKYVRFLNYSYIEPVKNNKKLWVLLWRLFESCVISENGKRNGWNISIHESLQIYGNDSKKK